MDDLVPGWVGRWMEGFKDEWIIISVDACIDVWDRKVIWLWWGGLGEAQRI